MNRAGFEHRRRVAVNREVMAAVANSHAPGLQGFLDSIAKLNIPNFMVVAIDKPLADRLTEQKIPFYFKENGASGNHKASAALLLPDPLSTHCI